MLENVHQGVVDAYQNALSARENSYSPYSHFKVGAAVKFKGVEQIFYGCNTNCLKSLI
jgi:Cytidine deaminase